jgi:hypothetical protein
MKRYITGAVVLVLAAFTLSATGANPSSAVAQETCTAKSCSQARAGCLRRCTRGLTSTCTQYCNSQYEECRQSGTFVGKFCGRKTKLRRE